MILRARFWIYLPTHLRRSNWEATELYFLTNHQGDRFILVAEGGGYPQGIFTKREGDFSVSLALITINLHSRLSA